MVHKHIFSILLVISFAAAEDENAKLAEGYPALMLIGGTAFIMILYYMTNAHVDEVKSNTWKMLVLAVSIFVAVATQKVMNYVLHSTFGLDPDPETPTPGHIITAASILIVDWGIVTLLLLCFSASILRLKGYGTVGGHLMGFASIALWTVVCKLEPFRNSAWGIVPGVLLIYVVSSSIFFCFFRVLGNSSAMMGRVSKEQKDRWVDQCKDTGNDFVCLGFSFILVTFLQFLIFGQLEPSVTDPKFRHSDSDIVALSMVSVGLLVVGGLVTVAQHATPKGCDHFMDLVTSIVSNTASMCLLCVFNWKFLPPAPSDVLGRLHVAIYLSLVGVFLVNFIAIIDYLCGAKQRALRGAFTGIGLVIGSSWEKTFDASFEAMDCFGLGDWYITCLSMLLVLIVFPAWLVYMLPKSDAELQAELKKTPPVWAACCDQCPCDCDDDDDDYDDYYDEDFC